MYDGEEQPLSKSDRATIVEWLGGGQKCKQQKKAPPLVFVEGDDEDEPRPDAEEDYGEDTHSVPPLSDVHKRHIALIHNNCEDSSKEEFLRRTPRRWTYPCLAAMRRCFYRASRTPRKTVSFFEFALLLRVR